VAFVILAFGFLFRYAFDQGWIGPPLRLGLGFAAGTLMLVVGLRLEGSRERFSQYLLGGAIGVYYLVGFAAYELYELVAFPVAFAFMSLVTVAAFVLSQRQRLPSLAAIGASGGLSTPFLVSTGTANVPALAAYTVLLLAGAGAIQFLRGWKSLLFVLGYGGLGVTGLAVAMISEPPGALDRVAVAGAITVAWALFGASPLLRAHFHRLRPEAWPEPDVPAWWGQISGPPRLAAVLLRLACVSGAFIAIVELATLFTVERATTGVLFGAGALVYIALARGLFATRPALNAAAETASILLPLGVALYFADYRVMLPLAVAGAVMHGAHARWELPGVRVLAHILFAQLTLLLLLRSDFSGLPQESPFGPREVGALGAIALGLWTSLGLESAYVKRVYRIAAHMAFLFWIVTQMRPLEFGQELISVSWGVYGIALLLLSLRLGQRGVQLAGLATLGLVAAKLLVVDMAQVDVIWRILLFMGFGGAFLGLSYLINRGVKGDRA
jgi:uncharacterized membrane protein